MRKVTNRDIVIKTPSSRYLVVLANGQVGITSLKKASHFSRRTKAKRVMRRSMYDNLTWVDINKKKEIENEADIS